MEGSITSILKVKTLLTKKQRILHMRTLEKMIPNIRYLIIWKTWEIGQSPI